MLAGIVVALAALVGWGVALGLWLIRLFLDWTRLACLARLAFGEGDYRVFSNDIGGAIMWLKQSTDGGPVA